MTERGILMTGPNVRATMARHKSQTRRLLNPQPKSPTAPGVLAEYLSRPGRFAPGDLLWVREAWWTEPEFDELGGAELPRDAPIYFEADHDDERPLEAGRYRHARFIPRARARLFLTVTGVSVERLQTISDEDAIREGLIPLPAGVGWYLPGLMDVGHSMPRAAYAAVWEKLHGEDSWAANPWVVAVSYRLSGENVSR